jgi:hypothetical protein
MVQIFTRGKPLNIPRKEAKEALGFFCDSLLLLLSPNISIKVNFIPDLYEKSHAYGGMWWIDQHILPRRFKMDVDAGLDRRKILLTLAHEAVHVRQYAFGQLADIKNKPSKKWLGRMFDEDYDYNRQPWELEASHLEHKLYKLWISRKVIDG